VRTTELFGAHNWLISIVNISELEVFAGGGKNNKNPGQTARHINLPFLHRVIGSLVAGAT
jgi:hypothetical protein